MTEYTYWTKRQSQEFFDKALKLESEGKYEEAVGAYISSLNSYPKNAQALYNLGIAYATMSNIEQAIRCWRRAIWLNSDFRNELVRAFEIEDERSETVLGNDFLEYGFQKVA